LQSFNKIAACGLAILTFLSPTFADASDLRWRNGRSEIKVTTPATGSFSGGATRFRHGTDLSPSNNTTTATFTNPLRASIRRVDYAVRQAAFEDSGPQLGAGDNRPAGRSVIVPEEQPAPLRAAQLEIPAGSTGTTNGPDAQLEEELSRPLTDLPPLDEPPFEDLETPTAPDTTPQPDPMLQQPPVEQQPIQQQPLQQPRLQPGTQFQPGIAPRPGFTQPLPDQAPQLSESTIEAERQKSAESCNEGLEDLREKTIDKLSLEIAVTGEQGSDFPYECTLGEAWHEGRCWEQNTYMWKASALCHKPLYFEDEQLERYGHSFAPCFQPFISGAHFFCTLPVLPYCMGVEPPCECIYALGHYRPGNCAPYMCNPVPLSPRGALFQAGAVWGTAAILP
jgi:hypothetical protein